MAKSVNIAAELERRDSDVAIPNILFPKIPPFSALKSMTKLFNFPGAVTLRRYRKGEVICRQGDAGWTAFYIPTTEELAEIREAPKAQVAAAEADLAKAEAKLADLETQRAGAGGDPKKLDSLRGKIAEAEEQAAEIHERLEILREARPYLEAQVLVADREAGDGDLVEAGARALERLRQALKEADSSRKDGLAALLREVITAVPSKKRSRAESLGAFDAGLARDLLETARADEARRVASVRLTVPRPRREKPKGLLALARGLFAPVKAGASDQAHPSSIPIDASTDLDYETREGVLNEGELFGEMSCLYRSPRSATIVAARDCYLLEMLRNVLDAMTRDAAFKARLDRTYRERVLSMQLRNIPILGLLEERLIERVQEEAELIDFPAGGLLYDENDHADDMHMIRGGIVKVMADASFLLAEEDITDWEALRDELAGGRGKGKDKEEAGPGERVKALLPGPLREALEDPAGELSPERKAALVEALNERIKDPDFSTAAGLDALAEAHRVGRKVWQGLADPRRASERDMVRCHRLLLEALYGNKVPAWQAKETGEGASHLFHVGEFSDWKGAGTALAEGGSKPGDPRKRVWDLLTEAARAVALEAKAGKDLSSEARATLVESLNAVLKGRPMVLYREFQDLVRSKKPAKIVMEFLPNNERWGEYDFQRSCRMFNRFLLDLASPRGMGTSRRPQGRPRILAYRSRGESIGEMSLMTGKARMATCVAYGHPEDDPEREVGPIQLVRISRELFEVLKRESPAFRQEIADLVARRAAENKRSDGLTAPQRARAQPLGRAEELGLLQGRKLMLIDLDRCTRCDECVRACVDTHDDGRSRLFLDGPRFGKYLVPATCRSCLDPVCMIGCPVGSIHRGGNGEIIIEDWCIGCELCASQCPYGAIQMHKDGIIAGSSTGWRLAPRRLLAEGWFRADRRDRDWRAGSAPFVLDREFRERLGFSSHALPGEDATVCFRYEFDVAPDLLGPQDRLILALSSMDEGVRVWIDGRPVLPAPADAAVEVEVAKKKSRDNLWWDVEAVLPAAIVRPGKNLIAVEVTPCLGSSDRLLELRLDREEGANVKLVEQQAVVCDLCSAQYGQRPACVTACPHDAAIRIDALQQLPTL